MVLVLAALYSIYRSRNPSANASIDDDGTAQQQQQGNDMTERLRRGGSFLYQNAVVRCTPSQASDQVVTDQTSSTEEDDGASLPRPLSNIEPPPDAVKQEWIDAVFGVDLRASKHMITRSIPACHRDEKVGVTLGRLAVGLYVQAVMPGSEAAICGVQPQSILVAINGLPVLAEPSRSLLERLWQYEGYYVSPSAEEDNEILDTSLVHNDGVIREPVSLEFIHERQSYFVLLLSNPAWGIQWASAAPNLPLVKRVYGLAAEAGLPKGSLMIAVNGRTIRDMDHVATACHIRDIYENGEALQLTTALPPVTARATHCEGSRAERHARPPAARTVEQQDGVQIKYLPLGYAIGSLCVSDHNVFYEESPVEPKVTEYALAVVTGQVEPPVPQQGLSRRYLRTIYPPCPSLNAEQLLDAWDPLEALLYCLRFQRSFVEGVDFVEQLRLTSRKPAMERLYDLTSGLAGAEIAGAFLLQWISLICAPNTSEVDKQSANEITSLLLKLSRKNESFCQRLYFLLRSYISTFETSKPDGESRNLMALLNCLELLRFAEQELAGRKTIQPSVPSTPLRRENSLECSVALETSIQGLELSPMITPVPISPESTHVVAPTRRSRLSFLKKSPSRARNLASRRSPQNSPRRPEQSFSSSSERSHSQPIDAEESVSLQQSPSTMYENMSDFLTELDKICATIERSLQKSFRQKIADWALQPWSAGKDAALAEVTADMRDSLETSLLASNQMLLVNPVESSELLCSIDCNECYILPSAHFPLLLTFNVSERRCSDFIVGEERLYRTRVELLSVKSAAICTYQSFSVEGAIAGSVAQSGDSTSSSSQATHHTWRRGGYMIFETRSSAGAPQTLSLRVTGDGTTFDQRGHMNSQVGFCWIDLSEQWKHGAVSEYSSTKRIRTHVWPISSASCSFDHQGDFCDNSMNAADRMELELRITTESLELDDSEEAFTRKRMLLYKHDDDLRQEAFTIHFIQTCNDILKQSGLDMKLLTFQCIPVGTRRGFVEWVPGSVPLSEICHAFQSSKSTRISSTLSATVDDFQESISSSPQYRNGPSKYGSLRRLGGQSNERLRRLARGRAAGPRGSLGNDPIQEYFRSVAYDAKAPYMIRRDVMNNYVQSCAGYSVITYILGIGDRHLDNLLLHPSGSFFHCDFSFILGRDPKKYLPLRITEDMIHGMGGKESDNYAKLISWMNAAFLTLRRPENVRILLSMIRCMKASCLPDVSEHQSIVDAIRGVRSRLRLDLSAAAAMDYMEKLVEASMSNQLWLAVDAIHEIGKNF
jgi:Phosphatidylinositol 3- and 4-kinase